MLNIPPITRSLLLANVACYLLQLVFRQMGIELSDLFGLHFILAGNFHIFQPVTYMFLHGSLTHLFFNMFSLWMFGGLIERTLGTRRFLTYYMVCGIGAALCQELWQTGEYVLEGMYAYDWVQAGSRMISMGDFLDMWTTIGASGACYGILLAFGMLYPNERIMLLIPPIPMKAKYFVVGYAAIELFSAYASNDNVAHFAHLGGMLFGWLCLRHWRRRAQQQTFGGRWEAWEPGRRPSAAERVRQKWNELFSAKKKENGNAHHSPTGNPDHDFNLQQKARQERMDEILDKIRLSGYDSLTEEEKRELFRISRNP